MADSTEVVLTWSPTNWITVTLMALISFGLIGAAIKLATRNRGSE